MIHDIDIVLSIVNDRVKSVSASGVSVISSTPDIANARIEFENGCVANLTASRISLKKMRKTRFFQKDAYISVDFLEKKVGLVVRWASCEMWERGREGGEGRGGGGGGGGGGLEYQFRYCT